MVGWGIFYTFRLICFQIFAFRLQVSKKTIQVYWEFSFLLCSVCWNKHVVWIANLYYIKGLQSFVFHKHGKVGQIKETWCKHFVRVFRFFVLRISQIFFRTHICCRNTAKWNWPLKIGLAAFRHMPFPSPDPNIIANCFPRRVGYRVRPSSAVMPRCNPHQSANIRNRWLAWMLTFSLLVVFIFVKAVFRF